MVATPGSLRTYVYDPNGNLTGISERRTTDATGADGFAATLADGPTRSYGMVYDSLNRLMFAQMYDDGQLRKVCKSPGIALLLSYPGSRAN
jgi:YD repeat-containing protein